MTAALKHCGGPAGRFSLLTRVRIARHFGSLEGRRQLARVRLLAFYVLFQSSPSHDDMMAFFVQEAEFVSELVGLLQACSSFAASSLLTVNMCRAGVGALCDVAAMDRRRSDQQEQQLQPCMPAECKEGQVMDCSVHSKTSSTPSELPCIG